MEQSLPSTVCEMDPTAGTTIICRLLSVASADERALPPRLWSVRRHVTSSRRQFVQGVPRLVTSQRTFRLRHIRQALEARRLTMISGCKPSALLLFAPDAEAEGGRRGSKSSSSLGEGIVECRSGETQNATKQSEYLSSRSFCTSRRTLGLVGLFVFGFKMTL